MLPIKKLYIDSRFKSSDSMSDSDMKIDLPMSLTFPEDSVFYVDDICIPVSWYVVDENRNNKFYFKIGSVSYVKTIPEGNYSTTTLNAKLVEIMNTTSGSSVFLSTANLPTNTIGISTSSGLVYRILTDNEAMAADFALPLQSINSYLNNTTPKENRNISPYVSGYVNLNPVRNIYITSGNLGSYDTLSVSGDRGVIKKVPVRANYNEMIYDDAVLGIDYLDCSRQSLSRLEFQLKDAYGNFINLHGNHWSCSLVFAKMKED